MTRLPRLASLRPTWPLALLLASIGLIGVAVFQVQRTARAQGAVVENALRDYAGFAAWSYKEHLQVGMREAAVAALGAVNHGDEVHTSPRVPRARDLPYTLDWDPRCACHRVEAGPSPGIYFGFTLGSDTLGVAVNTHARPEIGWRVDSVARAGNREGRIGGYAPAEAAWIVDTITAHVHGRVAGDRAFPWVIAERAGRPRWLAYTLMPTARGDTLVYGVEYVPEAAAAGLGGVLDDRGLLPAAFTGRRANREVVDLEVASAGGHPLFASRPEARGAAAVEETLPAEFGGMRVRARVRPEAAGSLLIGGAPRSRLPFLLGLLALSAALALVAFGQMRRERGLAALRTDFVASVSHELRTPLAQVRLFVETLRLGRARDEAERAWALDAVDRETRRLAHLVENVLLFARPGRGGAPERVELGAEVERVVDDFRPLASSRRAAVVAEAEPAPPVRLRRDAFRQVLLNLLDNAVKYGPAGQTVRVRVAPAGPGRVRVAVLDQGAGVPAAEREAVWKPFHRGAGAQARAAGGSGIGLTVVRDLVEQHGGRAWVEDAPGGGAAFVVEFPALAEAAGVQDLRGEGIGMAAGAEMAGKP